MIIFEHKIGYISAYITDVAENLARNMAFSWLANLTVIKIYPRPTLVATVTKILGILTLDQLLLRRV